MLRVLQHASSGVGVFLAMGADRLIIALACLAGITALVIAGKIDGTAAVGIYSALVGYVVGTGTSVRKDGG